jgi:putative membrane protein
VNHELTLASPFLLVFLMYILAVGVSNRRCKPWPSSRSVFWILGVLCALSAVAGPLAHQSHVDFSAHMFSHLLLGMLAPLLMALGAPVTLLLRTIHVTPARRISYVLKSWPVRTLSHPLAAAFLHIGGLWVLYTGDLFIAMQQSPFLHAAVHLHLFLAGYLFTVSMIYIDPTAHRCSFVFRAIVLIISSAGHGILSKYIYAYPPDGVPETQAQAGGMLMYYGGDAINLILIVIFCFHWFRATRPRPLQSPTLSERTPA